jgi:hypothetical protein
MTKLHYCKTNYNLTPPLDINPLLLQKYKDKNLLIIVSKEQQEDRLLRYLSECPIDHGCKVFVSSWWDLEGDFGLSLIGETSLNPLAGFDGIVIVGRERVDAKFEQLVLMVESFFNGRD